MFFGDGISIDSSGFIYDPDGISKEKLKYAKELKEKRSARISEYAKKYKVEYFEGKNLKVSADKNIVVLDHDQIGDDLFVRTRRPGDRIQPFGMRGSKKVQDKMVDAKIPRRLRDQIPIVVSDKGIVWIAGHVVADWARLRENSDKGLQLVFSGGRSI